MSKSALIVVMISILAIITIMVGVQAQTGGMRPAFVEFIQSFASLDKSSKCRLSEAQRQKVVATLEKISETLEKLEKSEDSIEKTLTKDQLEYIQAMYYTGRLGPVNEPPILDQISAESDTIIIEAVKSLQKAGAAQTGRPAR